MPALVERGGVLLVNDTAAERQLAATRWAHRALRSSGVVILDVETLRRITGSESLSVCGIAVIDTTGAERLNTPLRPSHPPLTPQAGLASRVEPEMASLGPAFASIVPVLLRATTGCVIATYNAPAVYALIMGEVRETGMDPQHLQEPSNWRCISQARSDWCGQPDHYFPLRSAHDALDRCHAALNVLREIAATQPNPADHP